MRFKGYMYTATNCDHTLMQLECGMHSFLLYSMGNDKNTKRSSKGNQEEKNLNLAAYTLWPEATRTITHTHTYAHPHTCAHTRTFTGCHVHLLLLLESADARRALCSPFPMAATSLFVANRILPDCARSAVGRDRLQKTSERPEASL